MMCARLVERDWELGERVCVWGVMVWFHKQAMDRILSVCLALI